jgi:sugar phosphate isomerase/epimerase
LGAAGCVFATPAAGVDAGTSGGPKVGAAFRFCLNTSTIRGQKLGIVQNLAIAAKAGYRGVEPWIDEIDEYVKSGGTLAELRRRIDDLGLTVESAIAFAEWIVDDEARRRRGLEEAKRTMEMIAQLGGRRIAAPPAGATDRAIPLDDAAGRFSALAELGEQVGVMPQLEVWGFSRTLRRLSETAYVAIESGRPRTLILPDVYHLYKGGSDFDGLRVLAGSAMEVFHMNDYPGQRPREKLSDADRVFPGDGAAPLVETLQSLAAVGFRGALSLELFNRNYWKQDALAVARTGLDKMRQAVAKALEG